MRKLFCLFLLLPFASFSQIEDAVALSNDLLLLTDRYMTPAAEGAVFQSAGGWYTSAKSKKLWDLEVSIQGNVLFIPSKFKIYTVAQSELQNFQIEGGQTQVELPTALGNDDSVLLTGLLFDDEVSFDTPEGIDDATSLHGNLQLSLGLWKGTSVMARYSPKIKIGDTRLQVKGLGVQHNLSQWFTTENENTLNSSVEVSLLIGYTNFTIGNNFDPIDLGIGTLEGIEVEGNSLLFSLVASKNYNRFDFFGGLGLMSTNFDYGVTGNDEGGLSVLNQLATSLSKNQVAFKADLGITYSLENFSISSMLVTGKFSQITFGINYNLNFAKKSNL